jgi:bifunctional N-acetylglucosamine-1-phosphate-uridyltransferase/glucosamine-1-phosphate-acetyltransferase GlmU-like protein
MSVASSQFDKRGPKAMDYVRSCQNAAKQLGVTLRGPADLSLSPSVTIHVDMIVEGFGAPKGTLVVDDYSALQPHIALIKASGFTCSSFAEPTSESSVDDLQEMLLEWGWAGPEAERPVWA